MEDHRKFKFGEVSFQIRQNRFEKKSSKKIFDLNALISINGFLLFFFSHPVVGPFIAMPSTACFIFRPIISLCAKTQVAKPSK